MLKTNGTELIDESADVCLHFSGHVTSPALGRVLSFCWNSRCALLVKSYHSRREGLRRYTLSPQSRDIE